MNETELIQKLIEKDETAFRYLIDQEQLKVFRLCVGFLHNKEDAEDIAQEVFIEVFRSADKFRGESKLSTWLYRIAVNKCLTELQKRKTKNIFTSVQSIFGLIEPLNKQEPHRQLEQKEQMHVITKAIDNLPENQKIAYTLAKYDDLSYQQIAEVMNISLPSVESLMFRAKNNLQKKLINYYKKNN